MDCNGDKPGKAGVQVLLFSGDKGGDLVVRWKYQTNGVLRRPSFCFQWLECCPSRIHQRIPDRKYDARWKQTSSCQIYMFCSVLTPQWSEWSGCTKNRTRPDISCIASFSSDNCPLEVEREDCSSPGITFYLFVGTLSVRPRISQCYCCCSSSSSCCCYWQK